MKYHDTGAKNPEHALARWFECVLDGNVSELRIQTGYFRLEAVRAIAPTLQKAAELNFPTILVIGSNDGDTTHFEMSQLMTHMAFPRTNAKLGIVSYGNYIFHPKVYHIRRKNGTQAAFVGSTNFTPSAITGGNVEAALSLDSALGDSNEVLNEIADAVDRWFLAPHPEGLSNVLSVSDLDALLKAGVLSITRPPRVTRPSGTSAPSTGRGQPTRKKLIVLPPWPGGATTVPPLVPPSALLSVPPSVPNLLSSTRAEFPAYLIFELNSIAPTFGAGAMSGKTLENGVVGLILKLNKDSARYFTGSSGTANINLPIPIVGTFRFGIFGKHERPRADLTINIRYVADNLIIDGGVAASNVMGYGFKKGESGHKNIRMLMPAAVKGVTAEVKIQGQPLPTEGSLILLEWPTPKSLSFGLTFLAKNSSNSAKAQSIYWTAETNGELVGGACWLPAGFSPAW
jgi:hypothetical protein